MVGVFLVGLVEVLPYLFHQGYLPMDYYHYYSHSINLHILLALKLKSDHVSTPISKKNHPFP